MSDRPTDKAIKAFGRAANKSYLAATMKDPVQLAMAANALADGLIDLATGLRATYIAIDEVKGLLQQKKGGPTKHIRRISRRRRRRRRSGRGRETDIRPAVACRHRLY